MGVYSNINFSGCLYRYANLNSFKYLKSETHLPNAQLNNVSFFFFKIDFISFLNIYTLRK